MFLFNTCKLSSSSTILGTNNSLLHPHSCNSFDFDKRSQEKTSEWAYLIVSQNCPFFIIYLKNQHIHFLVHDHSSWSTFGLHLVRCPKALQIDFLFKKLDCVKMPSSMIRLHGPWRKPTLSPSCAMFNL